ncbi:MAG: hypothetical protein U0Y68_03315 [Blastocatellia bacterium]
MKKSKTNRTQLKDIAPDAQELTLNDANRIKGGTDPAPITVNKAKTADKAYDPSKPPVTIG